MPTMTDYAAFCESCAHFGFASPTLTAPEFQAVADAGLQDSAYEIGCDLHAHAFDTVSEAIKYFKARAAMLSMTDQETRALAIYVAQYIDEETSRNPKAEVDFFMIEDAMNAYKGGAE